jgi:hypothetical protein
VITGCGHAGVVNISRYARRLTGDQPLHALLGGFHLNGPLFGPLIPRVLEDLAALGPQVLVPAHCTEWRAHTPWPLDSMTRSCPTASAPASSSEACSFPRSHCHGLAAGCWTTSAPHSRVVLAGVDRSLTRAHQASSCPRQTRPRPEPPHDVDTSDGHFCATRTPDMVRKSLRVKGGFWPRTAGRGRCRGNGFGFR